MNNGGLVEIGPDGMEFPAILRPSTPLFLLIQGGRILDCKDSPVTLAYSYANKQADIIVACGVINEYRQKEICAIVGHYRYIPFAMKWVLSVETSASKWGNQVPIDGNPGKVLRDMLFQLKRAGYMSDPTNLGKVVLEGSRRSFIGEGQNRNPKSSGA